MQRTVIVSGKNYIDIDALACAVAYAEYLTTTGRPTSIRLSKNLNPSITPTVKSWIKELNLVSAEPSDQVIVVDVSEPDHIDPYVNQDQITELYDHHFGFKPYWNQKIGPNSHIENVGACATLIYEQIKGKEIHLSAVSIDLLLTAIVSNTLNLKAQITNDRDIKALTDLKQVSKLPNSWLQTYYDELYKSIVTNPKQAITNDIRIQNIKGVDYVIAQIELWDSKPFLSKNEATIKELLTSYNMPGWFYTSPSINEGKNYIYCENDTIKNLLHKLIGAKFSGNMGETSMLWLRKEIIRELQK